MAAIEGQSVRARLPARSWSARVAPFASCHLRRREPDPLPILNAPEPRLVIDDSRREARDKAGVAQMEAQATCNRQVVGSSPTTGSNEVVSTKDPASSSAKGVLPRVRRHDGRPQCRHKATGSGPAGQATVSIATSTLKSIRHR